MKYQDRQGFWRTCNRSNVRLAAFAFSIVGAASIARADSIITFDSSQPSPSGETGFAPAALTANNDFSLWGVEYQLAGGDGTGCASMGGDSLCFGDTIGTGPDGLNLSLLSDPVLSGPLVPGVSLTLNFSAGTDDLDFDAAVGTSLDTSQCPVTPQGYSDSMPGCPLSVALYNSLGVLLSGGSYQWMLPNDSLITEGGFMYSGPAVRKAVLTFPGSDSSGSVFAIDNLTYQSGSSSSPTAPDPATSLLLGLALVALGSRWRTGLSRA
jgi:hypothetical protein